MGGAKGRPGRLGKGCVEQERAWAPPCWWWRKDIRCHVCTMGLERTLPMRWPARGSLALLGPPWGLHGGSQTRLAEGWGQQYQLSQETVSDTQWKQQPCTRYQQWVQLLLGGASGLAGGGRVTAGEAWRKESRGSRGKQGQTATFPSVHVNEEKASRGAWVEEKGPCTRGK